MKTLISTFREGYATVAAVYKLEPKKLVLLVPKEKDESRELGIKKIRADFEKTIKIETALIENYDIPKIAEKVCEIIDKEFKEGNEIYINITESRKPQALGALFAGFIKKNKVKQVFYIEQEQNKLSQMPLLSFRISSTSKKIMKEIEKGNKDIAKIIKNTKKSKTLVYNNIKQLKKDGYLTEKLELTPAGKICTL